MKLTLKQIIGVALLAAANGAQADCCSTGSSSCSSATLNYPLTDTGSCTTTALNNLGYGKTFFAMRPQHSNVAREQMGTAGRIHQFAKEEFHGDLSLALEWTQSREADKLGTWFFFNGTNSMTYGPNPEVNANTNSFDVNALNFGTSATGTIVATPRVQNLVADAQLYLGFDEFISGLWMKVGMPVNYVRTDMRLADTVTTAAEATFPKGQVADNATTASVYSDLKSAWVGGTAVGDLPVLNYGKIDGRRSHTAVAGLAFTLGYDFLRREHGSLGLALRAVAPTGNEPCATYLFEPVSGANNCWEVGGALNGAYELWSNNDDANLNIFVDAQVTHLGARAQRRLHGLNVSSTAKAGSTWLALKKFDSSDTYASMERAANKLALATKIGSSFMADAAAQLKYNRGNYGFAVGYNFWHRAKEEATAREASVFATDNYGIKNGSAAVQTILAVGSDATFAKAASSSIAQSGAVATAGTDAYLAETDIDVCPALHPAASSHKVFGSIEYNWRDNEWEPYLLIGGGYEFACKANDLKNAALDQWSVMAKGGIAF